MRVRTKYQAKNGNDLGGQRPLIFQSGAFCAFGPFDPQETLFRDSCKIKSLVLIHTHRMFVTFHRVLEPISNGEFLEDRDVGQGTAAGTEIVLVWSKSALLTLMQ